MRVLVVEDEQRLAARIAEGLRDQGMAVDVSHDGEDALEKAALNGYDVLVLDRDLPGRSGDEVCAELAGREGGPMVLMLTALSGTDDRVDGLSLGADDYLGKPFSFAELTLRIQALGRRRGAHGVTLTGGGVSMDTLRHTVHRGGRPIALTAKEFAVLRLLLAADGAVLSHEELLERAWDENADPFTNTVRVTVNRLRRKLGPPEVIETLVGAGYRIVR
ncbi:response regulator transcription factor [Actinacidiphila guanduensis]|jgi:DNA-binding response OmpR family regulator|uniref:DNA-binding response regulator, OmpR family, contains REC and winged-helix (WHTH) domain n=1 Tax=Actinacidiphila guanduensis TaxID=310781 RepID=A0A1G9V897_9ACTN|nr:response regulator transcription factor [Actinacidiphila guanduensis]SDM68438.1 DNA-binding response regulator, OmpR family, contains REC and winged-helix (wHTH) domain [Actinacidiphila guanduensis]